MPIQLIVYSKTTGRVRRVIDPNGDPIADAIAHANPHPGETVIIYLKLGDGEDHVGSWQAAASLHCGKIPQPLHPAIEKHVMAAAPKAVPQASDLHHIVNAAGQIVGSIHLCFDCGDSVAHFPPGHTIIPATS